ncbi:MAG TPA: glucose 1-dehydrogenase [Candidatus Atribacteria bacterium]|nr:glucose 1-dehydrogenase [Candidatus Atribacteria bacterium]
MRLILKRVVHKKTKEDNLFKRCFEGKVAIISGAGQGIGKQIALDLYSEGAKIAAFDIKEEQVNNLKEELNFNNNKIIIFQADVSKSNQVSKVVKETINYFGKIDLLINNAGILSYASIEDTTDDILEKILSVNLKGVMYCVREVVPFMKKNQYGRIVNISSITGKRGDNNTSPCYGASKGGIITLTKSLARQLGPYGINVNAVAPHAIMTSIMNGWDEEKKNKMRELIPVRRLGTVEDVSSAVLFLLSDASAFITGETININGGYYMD